MRMPLVGETAIGLVVALVLASTLLAQRPAAGPQRSSPVALVDTISATQSSARLKQSLDALKKEYESKAAEFKAESDRGNQMTEKLRTLKPGDPEFKRLEQEVAKLRADFELHGKRVTNDVQDREARLYFAFAREIGGEVARFAKANNIPLVLRSDPAPPDMSDPRMVMRDIQKLIVYQRSLDATAVVLDAMNRRAGVTAASRPPAPGAPTARPVQR